MKKQRKKYETPKRPWDKERIEKEKRLKKDYGLKRKKEIWRAEALLRKYRRIARDLAGKKDKEAEKELIKKLNKLGLLDEKAGLDDVLSLTVENILERRLQTIIFKKGLANSPKHARQLITHGHVFIEGKRILYPSYLTKREEEDKITVKQKVK